MSDFRFSTNLVIPTDSSAKDPITQREITQIFSALKTLATRLDETTGALSLPDTEWPNTSPEISNLGANIYKFYCVASAPIAYGQIVNFHNLTATTVQARPAQANSFTTAAGGYCLQVGGVAMGNFGEFTTGPGLNYGISGMTPGDWYFLSPSVAGSITAVQPTTPGEVYQLIGQAITDRILQCGAFNNWFVI